MLEATESLLNQTSPVHSLYIVGMKLWDAHIAWYWRRSSDAEKLLALADEASF